MESYLGWILYPTINPAEQAWLAGRGWRKVYETGSTQIYAWNPKEYGMPDLAAEFGRYRKWAH